MQGQGQSQRQENYHQYYHHQQELQELPNTNIDEFPENFEKINIRNNNNNNSNNKNNNMDNKTTINYLHPTENNQHLIQQDAEVQVNLNNMKKYSSPESQKNHYQQDKSSMFTSPEVDSLPSSVCYSLDT